MEGAAPPDPESGGTPTAMVAVPMLNTALGQRFSILGGTGTAPDECCTTHTIETAITSATEAAVVVVVVHIWMKIGTSPVEHLCPVSVV